MRLTKELRDEIRNQRQKAAVVDGKQVPGSIAFLKDLIAKTDDDHDYDQLMGELGGEYLRAGFDDEHLGVQRQRVAKHPDAAVMWLGLADALSDQANGAQEAKEAAATAVNISRHAGTLIRHALLGQAGVARKTNDPSLFASTLKELIADAPNYREDDCGLDDYVLQDLPDGFCPSELQDQYRQMLRQYGPSEDDDGSTPPADRPRG